MSHFPLNRRQILGGLAASSVGYPLSASLAADGNVKNLGRVVVIGAGFGGATAAKYLRKWSSGAIDVVLIERRPNFISCPMSNEVLSGLRNLDSLTRSYDDLTKNWGVKILQDDVNAIDADKRIVKTVSGASVPYDRLILSPGFDFIHKDVQGYDAAAQETILHAWKAGPQTVALRKQLEAMEDGGTYVLTVPKAPYRCPPGPYERACQIAFYFKTKKPKSKVIILDANDKVVSKEKLFLGVWEKDYKDIVEYRPKWNAVALDARTRTLTSELGDKQSADVLNLLPPQRAADIARIAGVINVNDRWADIDWTTFESTAIKNIHVLGDAIQAAPLMPKSGHMANQHGKAAAAALVEIFNGRAPQPTLLANTCYSLVDDKRGIHVASVHRYNSEKKVHLLVEGSGGLSKEPSVEEGDFNRAWAEAIWADTLG